MRSELINLEPGALRPGEISREAACVWHAEAATYVTSAPIFSAKEAALLTYFRAHPGRTLRREELAEQVWHQRYFVRSRTIDQTVAKLRKKLRPEDGVIISERLAGYRFEI